METWAAIPQEQVQAALAQAAAPDGLIEWALWLLKQMLTLNVAWAIVALIVGLLVAVGATEFSKRFRRLFAGPNWELRAQLYAAVWGAIVTTALIWVLTDWPVHGRVIAAVAVAPLAAFYAHRAYDFLYRLFPILMDRASVKLRGGEPNVDATP